MIKFYLYEEHDGSCIHQLKLLNATTMEEAIREATGKIGGAGAQDVIETEGTHAASKAVLFATVEFQTIDLVALRALRQAENAALAVETREQAERLLYERLKAKFGEGKK